MPAIHEPDAAARISDEVEPGQPKALPSGRSVIVRTTATTASADDSPGSIAETVEIRSPSGETEVTIVLTDQGPVVKVRGGRLEMESADVLALRCKRLEIAAEQSAHIVCDSFTLESQDNVKVMSQEQILFAGREAKVLTSDDIMLNGNSVRMQSV